MGREEILTRAGEYRQEVRERGRAEWEVVAGVATAANSL